MKKKYFIIAAIVAYGRKILARYLTIRLVSLISQHRLTEALEMLEQRGFQGDDVLDALRFLQRVGG